MHYLMKTGVAEVTAVLEHGSKPMLAGCAADLITIVVECPLHRHPASIGVRVADVGGRMSVGYFCKHFAVALLNMLRQCPLCAHVSARQAYLFSLNYVGGTTVKAHIFLLGFVAAPLANSRINRSDFPRQL
ncbi:hypothetical protein FOMPIDRAFT_1052740 [Fomitopsis schrenkii]|uniref:Uncharacterized protein n=1 Tax=Fomitopsis schrenkii TaxID=2126942 RepID=S8DWR0_FOMSC|nr:hypothetical protein FOMPIDRAFT_1052740 [Fomitopsis schrenkii]